MKKVAKEPRTRELTKSLRDKHLEQSKEEKKPLSLKRAKPENCEENEKKLKKVINNKKEIAELPNSKDKKKTYPENEKELRCQICLEIPSRRSMPLSCSHCFCVECMEQLREDNEGNKSCPTCRTKFNFGDIQHDHLYTKWLQTAHIKCEICEQKFPVKNFQAHSCKSEDSPEEFKADLSKVKKNTVTFTCPYCGQKNLDREGLLDHVAELHRFEEYEVVCPICVSHEYGDPNYKTYLHGHLMRRHQFDMDELIDHHEDEDDVLAKVLRLSMQEK